MSMGSLGTDDATTAHSCFIATDASLWCHGSNAYGQLTLNDLTVTSLTPFKTLLANVTSVTLGGAHSCVTNTSDSAKAKVPMSLAETITPPQLNNSSGNTCGKGCGSEL